MVRKVKFIVVVALNFLFLLNVSYVCAFDFKLDFETQYENASDKLVIDNVQSTYSLGTLGVKLSSEVNKKFKLTGTYGIGYHPNFKTGISGTHFNGPVFGSLMSIGAEYLLRKNNQHSIGLDYYYSEREVEGDNFRGFRNGQNLTVHSKAKMNLNEIALKYVKKVSQIVEIGGSIGTSFWNFNGSGVVFVDNVQLTKQVTKSNSSPVVSVFTILNTARPMTFSLTRRSYSADEFVESYELKANFAFSKR